MGTIPRSFEHSTNPLTWFWDLLQHELAPYPGRGALVMRLVTTSTIVMILCMTLRIPDAALAVTYVLLISRESLEATFSSARILITACLAAALYLIVGAMFMLGSAEVRFFWVVGTLFLVFYALSALRNYSAAVVFGLVTAIAIPLLDGRASGEAKVESTLWIVAAIVTGSAVTVLIEMAFAGFRQVDDLTQGIAVRLESIEQLLASYANDQEVAGPAKAASLRLAAVGTSRLRRMLHRSGFEPDRKEYFCAVLALAGRLVDLGANLTNLQTRVSERECVGTISQEIGEIRVALLNETSPGPGSLRDAANSTSEEPLIEAIEQTTVLLRGILAGTLSPTLFAPGPPQEPGQSTWLVSGVISDRTHLKFALKGCLASGLCYLTYNALFWPGISTSVLTCVVTGLTTIGASHQKQSLRFGGTLLGGVVIGMGAQVFILPFMDSIGAFAVLFALASAVAAWLATSSARLSYLGVQSAVAFNLIFLQAFRFQTSLVVARDRVVGVLLGLAMMWLAFDALWSTRAALGMRKAFVSGLRLLAEFVREPASEDWRTAVNLSYALREKIHSKFDEVNSLADSVLFEFGPSRQQDLVFRDHIQRWQPQFRTLFLMWIASTKYRLQLPGFELPESLRSWLQESDLRSAKLLDEMADWIEGKARPTAITASSFQEWDRGSQNSEQTAAFSLGELLRGAESLIVSLATDVSRTVA